MKLLLSTIAAIALTSSAIASDVSYTVNEDDLTIEESLTGTPGDATKGLQLFVGRKKGNCLACHAVESLKADHQFHGEVGPELTEVADIYNEAELRLRVVDYQVINEDVIMPSFLKSTGFHRADKKFDGQSILNAQEVEDIVAYLLTLKP